MLSRPVGTGGGVEWDAGALCLSSSEYDPSASRYPDESYGEKDRHKAPTHPRILPLSLHHGRKVSTDAPIRSSKFIRSGEGGWALSPKLLKFLNYCMLCVASRTYYAGRRRMP